MLVKDEAAVLLFHNPLCSSMMVISVASSTTQKAVGKPGQDSSSD